MYVSGASQRGTGWQIRTQWDHGRAAQRRARRPDKTRGDLFRWSGRGLGAGWRLKLTFFLPSKNRLGLSSFEYCEKNNGNTKKLIVFLQQRDMRAPSQKVVKKCKFYRENNKK